MSVPGFNKDGYPLTIAAAKREIETICAKHGIITDDDEALLRASDQRLEKNYRSMAAARRTESAAHARTVAEQLYSSRFRFIFELLQNVDDSLYAKGVKPTVTFWIKPEELILDSNERGFTLENAISICDVGKSSKTGNNDTTGEKGLGFKSVFGIADYVHIQSGHWSFRFEHRQGENGLGMITPIWTDATSLLPENVRTRLTLRYSDRRESFARRLVSEFEKIPNTIMFALRQLKELVLVVDGIDQRVGRITFKRDGELDSAEMRISTDVVGDFDAHTSTTTRLRLFTITVYDLPPDGQHTVPKEDVTVAFEVDSQGLPVIPTSGQHVFACLPVKRIPQLPFLINADFILTGNREDVIINSRNEALRNGVSSSFVGLVMEAVTPGDPLNHTWMRYLPRIPMQGLWEYLGEEIESSLKDEPILWSHQNKLHSIAHMRILPDWFLFDDKPLVADTVDDIYLSKSYESADVKLLKSLGLKQISQKQILKRIRLGLSSIHDTSLDEPWHTAFIALVQRLLEASHLKNDVRGLEVIPLKDNRWVSILSLKKNAVYQPYLVEEDSVEIEVPDGLGFQKLHVDAAADGERLSFYTHLGIACCDPEAVTEKILELHQSKKRVGTVDDFIMDLEILFWFGTKPSQKNGSKDRMMLVSDQNEEHTARFLFFPSDDDYNAEKLLAKTSKEDWDDFGMLDEKYLESNVSNHIRFGLKWTSYLETWGVKYFPDLAHESSNGWELHPLMELIALHNPDSFVANLEAHWSDYREDAFRIKDDLMNVLVPCLNGFKQRLCNTILPTEELLGMSGNPNLTNLPFLKLPAAHNPKQSDTWFFLKAFGVVCEVNTDFYLRSLHSLADLADTQLISTCANMYCGIAKTTPIEKADIVQQEFATQALIRSGTAREEAWYRSSDCIWEGPDFLRTKQRLSPFYGDNAPASDFFRKLLNMRDASHDDLIDELKLLSTELSDSSRLIKHRAQRIYTALAEMASTEPAIKAIRDGLTSNSLIYVDRKWLKPSECLWNCTVHISGRAPLDQEYPQLQDFFVDRLKVMTLDINILLKELEDMVTKTSPDINEVKQIILAIGQLLASGDKIEISDDQLRALKQTAFLPVRGPDGLRLSSVGQDITINDHKRYGELFKNKANIVDFGHEEITSLHPLFEKLELEDCYISSLIWPETTVKNSNPDPELENYIRDRAYALSCCAMYYNSPKYYNHKTSMHELLLAAKVFVCDEMWTELGLEEGDRTVYVPSDRVMVDVRYLDERLEIYIPSVNDGIYSCFHTELPDQLVGLLGIQSAGAMKVVYRILNDHGKPLEDIMRDEDIPEYTWLRKPLLALQETPLALRDDAETRNRRSTSVSSTSTTSADASSSDFDDSTVVTRANQRIRGSHPRVANSLPVPGQEQPTDYSSVREAAARDELYRKLLKEVIRQARRGRSPRVGGLLSLEEIDDALDDLLPPPDFAAFRQMFGDTGQGRFEENKRVGAAGELYVFEFLKASGIANFSNENWESSIRHYVGVLPEYRDLAPRRNEIADIMYTGNCPRLIDVLRKKTTSPYPAWLGSETSTPVNYHIEVKTTSGPCSTPFFMSNVQYRLLQDKACPPNSTTAPRDLYLIMRVFNLFSDEIGLKVYINPWHLRGSALNFVADPWKVIPTRSDQVKTMSEVPLAPMGQAFSFNCQPPATIAEALRMNKS